MHVKVAYIKKKREAHTNTHTHYISQLHSDRINLDANSDKVILEVEECMNPKTGRITLSELASKLILSEYRCDV